VFYFKIYTSKRKIRGKYIFIIGFELTKNLVEKIHDRKWKIHGSTSLVKLKKRSWHAKMREIKSIYLIKMKVKFGVPIAMLSLKNMSSKYLIENSVKINVVKRKKKKHVKLAS